ncbi:hypothetical protein DERP_000564 [Dermatophagoides pteronyssinus]|uniref:DUF1279 domain-containing protein n=1 Tax=Dermatophagoides pteronyssinus TaxID=6956 RepID=A0ABQ8J0K0_DERPT|nr:hypothetical protein DERP_000564 [Dermatophagoides pteronyssinus]
MSLIYNVIIRSPIISANKFSTNSLLRLNQFQLKFHSNTKRLTTTKFTIQQCLSRYNVLSGKNVNHFGRNEFLSKNQRNFFGTQKFKDKVELNIQPKPKNEWEELMKLSLVKRLHVMFKKYWYIAIPFHCINCAIWFASFFLLAQFGMNGAALISWIKPYVIESSLCPQFIKELFEKDADKLGSVAIALLLYKLATPGRYATTVFGTVYLLRYMLKRGVLLKTANEQFSSVRNSYISHAVNRNILKQKERFSKQMRKQTGKMRNSKHK